MAIRAIMPDKVSIDKTRLWVFFNAICSIAIDPTKFDHLEIRLLLYYVNWRCIFLLPFLDVVTMGLEELNQSHLYVLNNTQDVLLYIDAHKEFPKASHPKMTKKQML